MTAIAGYRGYVKVATFSVALVVDHDLAFSQELYDITAMNQGNAWKAFIPGLLDATLKIACKFDFTDTNGQLALWTAYLSDTLVTATVSPNGTSFWSITAYVKSINQKNAVNKEADASLDLQCTGIVTYTP